MGSWRCFETQQERKLGICLRQLICVHLSANCGSHFAFRGSFRAQQISNSRTLTSIWAAMCWLVCEFTHQHVGWWERLRTPFFCTHRIRRIAATAVALRSDQPSSARTIMIDSHSLSLGSIHKMRGTLIKHFWKDKLSLRYSDLFHTRHH